MGECQRQGKPKNLLERLQNLLERKPKTYDVTFCVGPEKKLVRSLKVILKAASPVFEKEFEVRWEVGINKGGEGIPLPDFDGNAFERFIKLTTLDTWSLTTLKSLNLPPTEMLNLITICRQFEMTEGLKNLTEISVAFFRSFKEFEKSDDFLRLSRECLQTILASDEIALEEFDIFQAACRWAIAQCTSKGMETSKENVRQVLGSCLYEIRFPLMTSSEFKKARNLHNILTSDESVQIYDYISLHENEKLRFEGSLLAFKTEPRRDIKSSLNDFKRLSLTNELNIVDNPPFECVGNTSHHAIVANKKIAIHGLGFFGPIDKDAEYDVTFKLYHSEDYFHEMNTRISAEKGKFFYWIFDEPAVLEPGELEWEEEYGIHFSLKGPPTSSVQRQVRKDYRVQDDGVEFLFQWHSNQLAEILYKNL